LAHYSFTTIDKEDTGFQIKGGIKVMPSQDNDNSGKSFLEWQHGHSPEVITLNQLKSS
jgi:hypothetical protein